MPQTSLATLIIQESKAAIYKVGLAIAANIGLPVTTWQAGDPTRALFHLESELLAKLEEIVVGFIRAGFLEFAAELAKEAPDDPRSRMWLRILAEQVYGVKVPEAVAASTTVILTNNGGGFYPDIEPGDITVKNSTTGATYRNTTGGTLHSGPGTTLSITVVADEPGSVGSAAAGEIDELVTGMLGVTCTNPTAAIGVDEQDPDTTVQQCRNKLDSLSPNGPRGAYSYVALNSELTGTTAITRARAYPDSETGDVLLYLAGPSGAVAEEDRAAVEKAILKWATPLCITPSVFSASNVTINVTYELWVYKSVNKSAAEVEEDVEAELEAMFARLEIGGDIIPPSATGALYHSKIEATIRNTYRGGQIFRVILSSPSGDTPLGNGQVAALGTVTGTVHIVVDP